VTETTPIRACHVISQEIVDVCFAIDAAGLGSLSDELLQARRVFVSGQGRSGLIARAFAIRLMHLGVDAHAVGDAATPAIGGDDLLVAITGSGRTPTTVHHIATAEERHARTFVLTAAPSGDVIASNTLRIPVRGGGVETIQHAGSLFEQTSLVVLDAVCRHLQDLLDLDDAALSERHANLQ
jgi:6-phospho-3-hexuloisomerase